MRGWGAAAGEMVAGKIMKLPFDRSLKGHEVISVRRQGSGSRKYEKTSKPV